MKKKNYIIAIIILVIIILSIGIIIFFTLNIVKDNFENNNTINTSEFTSENSKEIENKKNEINATRKYRYLSNRGRI